MANYLVTGSAGFIGGEISKRLINEGHNVVTIDNLSTGYEERIPKGVDFYKGDCSDSTIYEIIPQHIYDAIYHIAGQSSGEISFDDPIYDIRANAESTLLLLKFAIKNGCKRFIYAGTMSVYGVKSDHPVKEDEDCHPQSFYGVGKLASEHYMRIFQQYGINTTSLRLFNVYGPGQNPHNLRQGMLSIFLSQMLRDGHINIKGSPERYRDFIYIDDVVESFIRCLTKKDSWGKNINIASGKKTTVSEIIDRLVLAENRDISVKYEGSTPGDIHGIYADTSLMRSILGIDSHVPLDEGLIRMVNSAKLL